MAAKLVRSTCLLLFVMALWTSSSVLLPATMADHTVQPAAQPSLPATGKYRHQLTQLDCFCSSATSPTTNINETCCLQARRPPAPCQLLHRRHPPPQRQRRSHRGHLQRRRLKPQQPPPPARLQRSSHCLAPAPAASRTCRHRTAESSQTCRLLMAAASRTCPRRRWRVRCRCRRPTSCLAGPASGSAATGASGLVDPATSAAAAEDTAGSAGLAALDLEPTDTVGPSTGERRRRRPQGLDASPTSCCLSWWLMFMLPFSLRFYYFYFYYCY
jgi:hypothetical protein